MDPSTSIGTKSAEEMPDTKEGVPGWQIRCMGCDRFEPWDKFGIRPPTAGPEFTVVHCAQCKRLRTHIIEKSRR